MKKIAEKGTIHDMKEIPEDIRKVFVSAHDIDYSWHVRMQAAFQKFVDNAVSKTINFSNDAAIDDIKKAYELSYQLNCKGITVYRDGSREDQVLNVEGHQKQAAKESAVVPHVEKKKVAPRPRPEVIGGTTTKVSTGCGNLYVVINQDVEGKFFEVFTQMGKAGGCAASQLEAIGRLISLALRGGIDVKIVIEQLKGIRCPSPSWANGLKIFSCADAIARALEQRLRGREAVPATSVATATDEAVEVKLVAVDKVSNDSNNIVGVCPECGLALRHSEGCVICNACGYSKC
jgi:ribonucleoside-diphosphate reductase alpha chain